MNKKFALTVVLVSAFLFIKNDIGFTQEFNNFVYISLWNEFGGKTGIARFYFDQETGELTYRDTVQQLLSVNNTFLDKKRNILYIANEIDSNPDYYKGGGGFIYAFKIDPETGDLKQISIAPTYCPNPAYISLDATGKYLLAANHSKKDYVTKLKIGNDGKYTADVLYDDTAVELFAVNDDGTIGDMLDARKHISRNGHFLLVQSHPHTVKMSPSGKLFACCDKGEGKIYMYTIDRNKNKLILSTKPYETTLQSMPRYCLFHPNSPFFYNNYEGGTKITAYHYEEDGSLTLITTIDSFPEGYVFPEIKHFGPGVAPGGQCFVMSADGKFIYNVVRGKEVNSIAVFSIDQTTGVPTLIQTIKVDGDWVRGGELSPDGRFFIATCLFSGDIIVYSVGEDGKLLPTGSRAKIEGAAYVTFYDR